MVSTTRPPRPGILEPAGPERLLPLLPSSCKGGRGSVSRRILLNSLARPEVERPTTRRRGGMPMWSRAEPRSRRWRRAGGALGLATCCSLAWLLAPVPAAPPPAPRQQASAVERWADPDLPVTAGLEVWLDARRQNDARRALGKPEAADGDPVDTWYDGSGHGRHLLQKDA